MNKRSADWVQAKASALADTICPYCFMATHPRFMDWHKYSEHDCPIPIGKTLADIMPSRIATYHEDLVFIGDVGDTYGD